MLSRITSPFKNLPELRPMLVGAALTGFALAGTAAVADDNASTAVEAASRTIVLINPNSSTGATHSMAELARMEVDGQASVEERSNEGAPALLTTPEDMENAIPGVVQIGTEVAARDDVVAIIVSAFSDPGLEELRAVVDIPVYGIGEEVFHEAASGGREFGIVTVTPDEGLIESFRQKAISLGYEDQYRGVRVTPGDPKVLVTSPEKLDAALAAAVQESIDEDGSSAVIMGGGPLSASAIRLQPQFDVPLVVAVNAAARAALRELQ